MMLILQLPHCRRLSYLDTTPESMWAACRLQYEKIYPDMHTDYYWSDDFSPELYIAQAKAGLIATTEYHKGEELLLSEMLFGYTLLDFKDLHISRRVKKLLSKKSCILS